MTKEEAIKVIEDNWSEYSPQIKEAIEVLTPELGESREERIRRSLIDFLDDIWHLGKDAHFDRYGKADCADWKNWVENHGKHKNVKRTKPKDVIDPHLIDIPFGAKDSELMGATYYIPEGFHAEIKNNKVIIEKGEQNPAWSEEDEMMLECVLDKIGDLGTGEMCKEWLKSLKERIQHQPKQELTEIEQELNEEVVNECVDLGLPSGTLWKSANEDGYYTYDEAVKKFGCNLPSKKQWEELKDKCKWVWKDNGYDVTGPNGNMIFLPAAGYHYNTKVNYVGGSGFYWSSTYYDEYVAWYTYFVDDAIILSHYLRDFGLSVRLVK